MKRSTIICNDCLLVPIPNDIRLLYADPPFGRGCVRKHQRSGNSYSDKRTGQEYHRWLLPRLQRFADSISDGWFVLQHDPLEGLRIASKLENLIGPIFGVVQWQDSWVSGYRGRASSFFPRIHDSIFFWKFGSPVFNPVLSSPPKGYSRRGASKPPADRPLGDVWIGPYSPGQLSFATKHDWPDEKPIALLERIISATTQKNDLVVDIFCGSGTTAEAALKLNRIVLAIDKSKAAVHITRTRIT